MSINTIWTWACYNSIDLCLSSPYASHYFILDNKHLLTPEASALRVTFKKLAISIQIELMQQRNTKRFLKTMPLLMQHKNFSGKVNFKYFQTFLSYT